MTESEVQMGEILSNASPAQKLNSKRQLFELLGKNSDVVINSFLANVSISYPLKKKHPLHVFWIHIMRTLARNGLHQHAYNRSCCSQRFSEIAALRYFQRLQGKKHVTCAFLPPFHRGEQPSGLRRYIQNQKVPYSNSIRYSVEFWDPTSLRDSQ